LKKYQQLILGLALALIALYYTLNNVSFSEVVASFKEMNYIYIIPATALISLTYVFRAYRWQALLESSLKLNVSELYAPMMVGFMGNFLPARAAEILRPYLLSQKHSITFSAALASIIMERLFDLIMLLCIFIWVFLFEAEIFSDEIKFSGLSLKEMAIRFGQISLFVIIIFFIFIYALLRHKIILMKLVSWLTSFINKQWSDKIKNLIDEFAIGCAVVKNFGTLAKVSIYSVFVWLGNIFWIFPLYFAFNLQHKTLSSLLVLAVIVAILITVFPTPGFLGSFNAGIFIALHQVMGESEIQAVSLGMVAWVLASGVILAGGVYFIFHDHISLKSLVSVKKETDI